MEQSNLRKINDSKAEKALLDNNHQELLTSAINVSNTVLSATASLIKYLEGHTSKTQVVNQLKSINTPDALRVIPFLKELDKTLQKHENTDLTEITAVMKSILDEAKKIPKELPAEKEEKFIDYTEQVDGLIDAIKAVGELVKAQKLVVEAPIVNVPQTKINVEAPNLKPLQSSIKDVVEAVKGIVIPEYKTDNAAVEDLIRKSNKLLKEIVDKPISQGGGGGGRATPYQDSAGIPAFVTTDSMGSIPTSLKQANTILFAKVDTAASGDTPIVAAVASKKIKLLSCKLISSGTVSIKWRSATTDLEGANPLVANSGYVLPASSPGQGHYLETAVNTALNINLSGAIQVSGHISYYLEA